MVLDNLKSIAIYWNIWSRVFDVDYRKVDIVRCAHVPGVEGEGLCDVGPGPEQGKLDCFNIAQDKL